MLLQDSPKFKSKEYLEKNLKIQDLMDQKTGKLDKEMPLISIVIPLYNEEKSILNVIKKIPNHFKQEIIVVDDGSTDNSGEVLKSIKNKELKIIRHKKNQGYGAALQTGFKHAKGDVIVTIDADGQHNPEEIPNLIEPIVNNRADMVIGSRYLGKCKYKIPFYARLGEFTINLAFRILYHKSIGNNQCGFRAFKRASILNIKYIKNKRMAFSTEFLFELFENKKKIIEVPISMNPRRYGTSHVNLSKILRSIISILFHYGLIKKIYLYLNF